MGNFEFTYGSILQPQVQARQEFCTQPPGQSEELRSRRNSHGGTPPVSLDLRRTRIPAVTSSFRQSSRDGCQTSLLEDRRHLSPRLSVEAFATRRVKNKSQFREVSRLSSTSGHFRSLIAALWLEVMSCELYT